MLELQGGDYLPSISWFKKVMHLTGCNVVKAVYERISFQMHLTDQCAASINCF